MVTSYKTEVRSEGGYTIVKLYDTDILKINSDEIILNSGGFLTKSTKDRLNDFSKEKGLEYNVFQRDKVWYVSFRGKTIPFYDNMVLNKKDVAKISVKQGSDGRKAHKRRIPTNKKWHSTDGWRGYYEYPNSVTSTWATGEWADAGDNKASVVKKRIQDARNLLAKNGIGSKVVKDETSNSFSTSVNIVVHPADTNRAKKILGED